MMGMIAAPEHALNQLAGLAYAKGHGTGNDFVLVDDPEGAITIDATAVAALCDRHRGIGGDGLIRAVRSVDIAEGAEILNEDDRAEWFMDYRNGDGSIAEMCGNGVRVFVAFLIAQGHVTLEHGDALTIGTRAGVKHVVRTDNGFSVDMGPWEFIFPEAAQEKAIDSLVQTRGLDVDRPALSVSMGNPHTVVALADEDELQDLDLTRIPSVRPLPPHGTNVEFVVPAEPLVSHGVGNIAMRVHERGVGETQSCGTGACAAVVATRHWAAGGSTPDQNQASEWNVNVPGGTVVVKFIPSPDGSEHVELSGPAQIVAGGVIAGNA
ncbi:diaminopimelate epimerase [Neomicrococcus aestuarii]|uniref:Diaminopimelate epimerase n=2 Tax=Neomicrococcus aestuarii TaxID=556325 RepID=A0A1L2ZMQ0_9MICC|nr:diaminopimelate epimerase [Neomicrococcus aestuarii]APF40311.1 diaminopimelate epimerase [Neomicrococcus aestuarii]